MASLALSQYPPVRRLWVLLAGALLLALGAALIAQVGGDRGIIPVASSEDIEVRGIKVDVAGKNPEDARLNGWREAQKLAWEKIHGPDISESQLEGLVSAIVVEQNPARVLAITDDAVILERGAVVHACPSAALASDTPTLDRYLAVGGGHVH